MQAQMLNSQFPLRNISLSSVPAFMQLSQNPGQQSLTPLNTDFKKNIDQGLPIFRIQRKKSKSEVFGRYSRKEKSLGQLSRRFLEIFGCMTDQEVSLDSVTQRLGVERRRIYDIINILESLGVVFRRGKNHYFWIGLIAINKKIKQVSIRPFKSHSFLNRILKFCVKNFKFIHFDFAKSS